MKEAFSKQLNYPATIFEEVPGLIQGLDRPVNAVILR